MAETGEKPTDRILIDVYDDSFELSHTPGLNILEVATLLYLSLQQIEKQTGALQDEPTMLQ